ncbi:NUDIX hydrolase [Marinigracilibium pacificum]|uniref:NUDIX hydrolase n=1 Tax=Marinigracilibium pacificum TaxID=2729599 RepID=A0A848IWF6_9BACT|nr:NUDIX hydrolase [Marinigracilibium pacificum]NMM48853.1 NUDIX hydrolase [Marinigracilibium pacificum]
MNFDLIPALKGMKYKEEIEEEFIEKMIHLHNEEPEAYTRKSNDAHFTASAILIDQYCEEILLLNHKKLGRWLQPGGHADGEKNLPEVSMKELHEETNALSAKLYDIIPFDVDIHKIPESGEVKEHYHYDLRFLWITDNKEEVRSNKESKGLKWVSISELADVTDEESFARIQRKLIAISSNILLSVGT